MAIQQAMCTAFKVDLLAGNQDFDTDVFKIALYTSAATLDASTTAYTTSGEVAAGGNNIDRGNDGISLLGAIPI